MIYLWVIEYRWIHSGRYKIEMTVGKPYIRCASYKTYPWVVKYLLQKLFPVM